ncbi:helix-turn-helix domain-containing protein [Pusillimonas sp. CC-YST705]|uniref:Helix-turn-helix domain-containing protein n=1 Tax=Mesopusillimonas faecipullorum TaxID=2755040 RepID=A0ABS8CCZ8_9BURK|nr:helix-turn-helix domain-containing protein [Mesopusillimonas faecipullorum]MCB5363896.1 helix-turn-helix domain-containing protein [Mesopusillimonas faecipullorum]
MAKWDMFVGLPSHILLVGADHDFKSLAAALQERGLSLSKSELGAEGYERALTSQPDLILATQDLPGMDGLSLLRLLKSSPLTLGIPVILLTSNQASVMERLAGFREGAVDVVHQPFFLEEVLARIAVQLGWLKRIRQVRAEGLEVVETEQQRTWTQQEVLVRAVQKHIAGNLSVLCSSTELARRFAVSERRLTAAFKACLNQSVFAYARQERMSKAQYLLAHTALSMDAISTAVGFSSAANFSTAFHAYFKTTPTAYRSAEHGRAWKQRDKPV